MKKLIIYGSHYGTTQSYAEKLSEMAKIDVTNEENTNHIKKSISQQVPQHILDRTTIFHLRGGMDYSQLNFAHRTMMSMVYKKAKNTPDEQKTPEVREMIATYNQKFNFVDFDSLYPMVDFICKS